MSAGIEVASERPVADASHTRRLRVVSAGGAATTAHVAGFDATAVGVDIVMLSPPQPLADWCDENGVGDAITAGFFDKKARVPLGELWISGRRAEHRHFVAPWKDVRACLHVDAERLNIGPRPSFDPTPRGHLLQATGPSSTARGRPRRRSCSARAEQRLVAARQPG